MQAILLLGLLSSLVSAFDFTVGVGKDETTGKKGIGFDPSVINPVPGDSIVFEFRSGAHSVVQSTFENPCTPMDGGFNTGVQTVADNLEVDAPGLPQVRLLVNNTDPLWFFDQAGGLCNKGAVLAVNPSGSQTAAAFKENASKAPAAPASSANPNPTNTASGSSTSSGTSAAPATSTTPANSNSGFRDTVSGVAILFGLIIGLL